LHTGLLSQSVLRLRNGAVIIEVSGSTA
jgi:hypothetical protein